MNNVILNSKTIIFFMISCSAIIELSMLTYTETVTFRNVCNLYNIKIRIIVDIVVWDCLISRDQYISTNL